MGLWVVAAPNVLGDWTRGVAANEALWSGLGTLALATILGVNHRFGFAARPTPSGRARV